MLRAVEVGISISDLDYLSIGMILDMFAEKINDADDSKTEDARMATEEDVYNF